MWKTYYTATSVDQVLDILAGNEDKIRIIAGATDLILEIERGIRTGIETLVDITRIPGLDSISMDEEGWIHLGPMVTHNDCVSSKLIREYAYPLAQAAWEVGAPQIRNRGTVAGNLITASPANDTITPLMALGALVTLRSQSGERVISLDSFYTGVRGTVMQPNEMLVDIHFPGLKSNQRAAFIKLGLRRAQAIAVVNAAVVLTFVDDNPQAEITQAVITLGAVAPTIIHAGASEEFLVGRRLDPETIEKAGELALGDSTPIDDLRSSADYRREMVRVCVLRCLRSIAAGAEGAELPIEPITLDTHRENGDQLPLTQSFQHNLDTPIVTRINGVEYVFKSGQDKTLLRLIHEDAGLTGTKEGCAEGECGACTVFLDGRAVMSCLVPAVRAHGAEIITIEGVATDGDLHPVQQAFVDSGAVQCGYCTPGFIMSAVKLLEEQSNPTREQINTAISGNLCRCTGYYKIVEAIEKASAN